MLYHVTLSSDYYTAFYCQGIEFDNAKNEVILIRPDIPSPYDFGYVALHVPTSELVKIEVVPD